MLEGEERCWPGGRCCMRRLYDCCCLYWRSVQSQVRDSWNYHWQRHSVLAQVISIAMRTKLKQNKYIIGVGR